MSHSSNRNLHRSFFATVVVALLFVAGCGGSVSPTAPPVPEPLTAAAASSGSQSAAISGQIVGGGSSASSSLGAMPGASAMGGIQVTIEGTSAAATTDGDGKFLLVGVPSGNIVLHISGGGTSANLTVQGVGSNQFIQITIQVQPGSASVVQQSRSDLDWFEGTVDAIDPALLAFTLADSTVILTDISTYWDTGGDIGSFAALAAAFNAGSVVHVQGRMVPTLEGLLLATIVKAQSEDLDVEDFRLSFNPDKWSLGWVDNGGTGTGSSAVEARISDGPFGDILFSSIEMEGPDGVVMPFGSEIEPGERFEAKFTKAQVISIATSIAAGDIVDITVRGILIDLTPWELTAPVEISAADDEDDDTDDDDGKNDVTPAVAAQAIADIQVVIDYLNGLVAAGDMAANDAKPLINKLDSAIASLQKLNGNPAVNQLESFLNQLDSSAKTGKISEDDADFVEELVEEIIDLIEGDD